MTTIVTHQQQVEMKDRMNSIVEKNDLDDDDIVFLTEEIQHFDQKEWKPLLEEKLKELEDYKVYRFVVAIEPKKPLIDKIYKKIKAMSSDSFVLDIQLDASIVAGFTLEMNGIFYDQRVSEKLYQFITK